MPVVNFHLSESQCNAPQGEELIRAASRLMADTLQAPLERIRVFITAYPNSRLGVAGQAVSQSGAPAPYFECTLLAGRPTEQRQNILRGMTELLVTVTGADKALIRGCCRLIAPEDWCIAGEPAAQVRQQEIEGFSKQEETGK